MLYEVITSLDEVQITAIRDMLQNQQQIGKRRETILQSLVKSEQLTPELQSRLSQAATLVELEDIYLPFRPKRRTRAAIAREAGYEPLADVMYHRAAGSFSLPDFLDSLQP